MGARLKSPLIDNGKTNARTTQGVVTLTLPKGGVDEAAQGHRVLTGAQKSRMRKPQAITLRFSYV